MAGGNWAEIVFNQLGEEKPTDFRPKCKTRINIYKSWIEVYFDKVLVINEMREGHLYMADGSQLWVAKNLPDHPEGVFYYLEFGSNEHAQCEAGIGVYGFNTDWKELEHPKFRPERIEALERPLYGDAQVYWEGVRPSDIKTLIWHHIEGWKTGDFGFMEEVADKMVAAIEKNWEL